ncbi:MAG: hypothetical protein ACMZI0_04235 [Symbiopectobacterium sp.]|uniref:hypothetical protein n=1 Tax=Symbiopectobacterium sp. TaxID=2952789 RepID=UPI0039E7FFCD
MAVNQVDIVIREAKTDDIHKVKALLERYHAKNLDTEQRTNGFVTTDMTVQQLEALRETENGVIKYYMMALYTR